MQEKLLTRFVRQLRIQRLIYKDKKENFYTELN